jgi:phosphoglycerol transferase
MSNIWLIASLVCVVLSLALGRGIGRCGALTFAVLVGLWLLATTLHLIADSFTGHGVDESVIYHLRYGLGGAGLEDYQVVITVGAAGIVIALAAAVLAHRRGRMQVSVSGIQQLTWGFATVLAVGLHPVTIAALVHGFTVMRPLREPAIPYVVATTPSPPETPLNLVFVYLEGLERGYFDQSRFPGLLPGLTRISREGMSFTELEQVYGTGFTIAGITSSQCGVPLVGPSGGNSMSGMDRFLGDAHCLGDVLSGAGYHLEFIGGASLRFAGKGKFFRTHGFDVVLGREELQENLADRSYMSTWGLFDDSLLDVATERLAALESRQPFGLFALTLDTHHPSGNPSKACEASRYSDGSVSMLNAVHCSDRLISEFVDRLRNGPLAANTLVVLASDHLSMQNDASDLIDRFHRRNFLLVLPPTSRPLPQPKTLARRGSMLDVAPTLLSMMDLDVPALGFGRDLRRGSATWIEATSSPNDDLIGQIPFLEGLWDFPSIDAGVKIDALARQAHLGSRTVDVPLLVTLEDDGKVRRVLFDSDSVVGLTEQLLELEPDRGFVWVDECRRQLPFVSVQTMPAEESGAVSLCMMVGRLDSPELLFEPVSERRSLEFAELLRVVNEPSHVPSEAIRRAGQVRHQVDVTAAMDRKWTIKSAGYGHGPSYINQQNVPLYTGERVLLGRGINVVGMSPGRPISVLGRVDLCVPEADRHDSPSLRELLASGSSQHSLVLAIVDDTAICLESEVVLEHAFDGTPMKHWASIGYRHPYVAMVAKGEVVAEFVGRPDRPLLVQVRGRDST